ncbi:MAG: hypothetical protein AAF546_09660 [Verrucomicrobiota bacterium]
MTTLYVRRENFAMSIGPLPTEEQRIKLHGLVAAAFIEIRLLGWAGESEQIADLADAFHNIPREIYGWGGWNVDITRAMLQSYQDKYHAKSYSGTTNYVSLFDTIFLPGGEQGAAGQPATPL